MWESLIYELTMLNGDNFPEICKFIRYFTFYSNVNIMYLTVARYEIMK